MLLYSLPPDSKIGDVLENAFIKLLWNDLQHPPISFVGKAKYRSADGSGNNFFNPRFGAAGERKSSLLLSLLVVSYRTRELTPFSR